MQQGSTDVTRFSTNLFPYELSAGVSSTDHEAFLQHVMRSPSRPTEDVKLCVKSLRPLGEEPLDVRGNAASTHAAPSMDMPAPGVLRSEALPVHKQLLQDYNLPFVKAQDADTRKSSAEIRSERWTDELSFVEDRVEEDSKTSERLEAFSSKLSQVQHLPSAVLSSPSPLQSSGGTAVMLSVTDSAKDNEAVHEAPAVAGACSAELSDNESLSTSILTSNNGLNDQHQLRRRTQRQSGMGGEIGRDDSVDDNDDDNAGSANDNGPRKRPRRKTRATTFESLETPPLLPHLSPPSVSPPPLSAEDEQLDALTVDDFRSHLSGVYFHLPKREWRAVIGRGSRRQQKTFSVRKYGFFLAKQQAEYFRTQFDTTGFVYDSRRSLPGEVRTSAKRPSSPRPAPKVKSSLEPQKKRRRRLPRHSGALKPESEWINYEEVSPATWKSDPFHDALSVDSALFLYSLIEGAASTAAENIEFSSHTGVQSNAPTAEDVKPEVVEPHKRTTQRMIVLGLPPLHHRLREMTNSDGIRHAFLLILDYCVDQLERRKPSITVPSASESIGIPITVSPSDIYAVADGVPLETDERAPLPQSNVAPSSESFRIERETLSESLLHLEQGMLKLKPPDRPSVPSKSLATESPTTQHRVSSSSLSRPEDELRTLTCLLQSLVPNVQEVQLASSSCI